MDAESPSSSLNSPDGPTEVLPHITLNKDKIEDVIDVQQLSGGEESSSVTESNCDTHDAVPSSPSGPSSPDAIGTHFGDYERHLAGAPATFATHTQEEDATYSIHAGTKLALVLNHQSYFNNRANRRNGTDKDCEVIKKTFEKLGFHVKIVHDQTAREINKHLVDLQHMPNLSCLALFILTHGEDNGVLYAYDTNIRLDKHIIHELTPPNCPSLAGKPKLLFLQACQGHRTDDGINVRIRHTSTDSSGYSYRIPTYSDFLIFQASYYGHYSFRSGSGSWFIQSLCDNLDRSDETDDLMAVLTRVSRYVALKKASNVPHLAELHDKKQIPLRQDTLIRSIYLKGQPAVFAGGDATPLKSIQKNKVSGKKEFDGSAGGKKKKEESCNVM